MVVFYTFSQWVTRIVYVNLLWIFFSVIGLLLLGFFPATASMFAVIRKWLMGDIDFQIGKFFWGYYKKQFIKTNIIGYLVVILGLILYVDLRLVQHASIGIYQLLFIPLLVVIFLFFMMALYIFPTFVHYELTIFQVFKYSFFAMFINPIANLVMIVGTLCVYFLISTLPGFLPFIGGSGYAFVIMGSTFYAFMKVQRRQIGIIERKSVSIEK